MDDSGLRRHGGNRTHPCWDRNSESIRQILCPRLLNRLRGDSLHLLREGNPILNFSFNLLQPCLRNLKARIGFICCLHSRRDL